MLRQEAYEAYRAHFEASPAHVLRDCLELVPAGAPVPLEEVQPAADILTRFCTGGMSLGAISRETHETIAIAMNRIGGARLHAPPLHTPRSPSCKGADVLTQVCRWQARATAGRAGRTPCAGTW